LQAITEHFRRFKRGKRGISNVIVAMLSLVLVVIVVGNVVLWSYQMNQVDWEKMQENIKMLGAENVIQNWTQHPSAYLLKGSTSLVSGGISNLTADDGSYMTFRSYNSGTGATDYVDNSVSNVDSSTGKGTHSNFTAQQYGPDSIYDRITEENTGGGSSSFGSSSSTTYGVVAANDMYGSLFTSPADAEGATLESISWYGRVDGFGSGYAKAILVLHSNMQIIAVSDSSYVTTTTMDRDCAFSSPPTLSGNTQYVLMMIFSVNTRFYYASGSYNQGHYDTTNSYTSPYNPTDYYHNNYQYRIQATYTKTNNYELDLEEQWTNTDYSQSHEELAIYANQATNTHALYATGGYMIVGGNPDWGSTAGTISFWIKWDSVGGRPWGQTEDMEMRFSGSNLVLDWGPAYSLTSSTSFVAGKWYFIAVTWNEYTNQLALYVGDQDNPPTQDAYDNYWTSSVSTLGVMQNNFLASKGGVEPVSGRGDELRYWTTDRSLAEIQSNYNAQLTGTESNLRSYFKLDNNFIDTGSAGDNASGSGSYAFQTDTPFNSSSETIRVDVWFGGSWQNVFSDLSNGWNNVSVSSYLTSSTFTIRFKGGSETGDLVQDRWNIDATVLHVWSDEYTSEVEFTGVSNTENWTQLNWMSNTAWTTASVSVTIQLYNFTSGAYQTSGFGYVAYTSSATPNTDENSTQSTSVGTTDFRNATGYWKIKIIGVKTGATQFDLKADFIEFNEVNQGGALITLENDGSLTCHIVSVWVNNSTIHQRYTVNTFINSGETLSQAYSPISLPNGSYTIRVSTERGNMAVLATS
jgi:hypothetical protein